MKETKPPRELAIESNNHQFYEELKKGKYLPELKRYEMAYLFVIAMAYGYYYDKRKPIKNPKRSVSTNFVKNQFDWLVKAIAISTTKESVEIIPDEAEIYKIAEEYANGGIEIIKKALLSSKPGEFELTMEKELSKIEKSNTSKSAS